MKIWADAHLKVRTRWAWDPTKDGGPGTLSSPTIMTSLRSWKVITQRCFLSPFRMDLMLSDVQTHLFDPHKTCPKQVVSLYQHKSTICFMLIHVSSFDLRPKKMLRQNNTIDPPLHDCKQLLWPFHTFCYFWLLALHPERITFHNSICRFFLCLSVRVSILKNDADISSSEIFSSA